MIKIGKILVPTDFSKASLSAIRYALSLARDHDAAVIVCHVVSPEVWRDRVLEDYYIGSGWVSEVRAPAVDELLCDKGQELRRFFAGTIEPELLKGAKIIPVIRLGKVVEEIVAAAKETNCDLIVMTSTERSWLGRLFSMSLTQEVVRLAPCPVLSIQPWARISTERGERISIKQLQLAGVV